jgi:hypothetical protein
MDDLLEDEKHRVFIEAAVLLFNVRILGNTYKNKFDLVQIEVSNGPEQHLELAKLFLTVKDSISMKLGAIYCEIRDSNSMFYLANLPDPIKEPYEHLTEMVKKISTIKDCNIS